MNEETNNSKYWRYVLPAGAILFGLLLVVAKTVFVGEPDVGATAASADTEAVALAELPDTEPTAVGPATPKQSPRPAPAAFATSSLAIRWRERTDTSANAMPNDYDYLRALASNGDAVAAEKLGQMLEACAKIGPPPQTDAEFEEELRIIREEYMRPVYENGIKYYEPVREAGGHIDIDLAILTARSLRLSCDSAPLDKRGEATEWLTLAETLQDDATAVSQTPEAMWDSGDPSALIALSDQARRQYESGVDPAGLVLSYAFFLAYESLLQDARDHHDASLRPAVPLEYVNYFEAKLRPVAIVWGNEMAKDLIASNANCCVAFQSAGIPLQ